MALDTGAVVGETTAMNETTATTASTMPVMSRAAESPINGSNCGSGAAARALFARRPRAGALAACEPLPPEPFLFPLAFARGNLHLHDDRDDHRSGAVVVPDVVGERVAHGLANRCV